MTEAEFLDQYDPAAYARPSIAVDLVLIGQSGDDLAALLIQRGDHPYAGRWALPGGFVRIDEALDAAAARVLLEKAGIGAIGDLGAHLEQLYTFGAVDRDPRMRIVTVAYLALLDPDAFATVQRQNPALTAARITADWPGEVGGPIAAVAPDGAELPLAFDHGDILAMALLRLRGKLDYSDVGFALLPAQFTLRQLQSVHEAVLGTALNKPAFRRRMLDKGWLAATGAREQGTSYRPAELYRFHRPL